MKIKYLIIFSLSINLIMIVIELAVKFMKKSEILYTEPISAHTTKRRRGRPKCFDEQWALQKAMLLFWEFGYEATSISDLTQSLNITAPSLYRTFGDKSQLFQKCLDYYLKHEACSIQHIFQHAKTAKIAIELYLHEVVKRLIQDNKPTGCMLVVATMNCSEENQQLQQQLQQKRHAIKLNIQQRLAQGIEQGDLAPQTDLVTMTNFYSTILQGLTIQARDGFTRQQLEQVVQYAMLAWPQFEKISSHQDIV